MNFFFLSLPERKIPQIINFILVLFILYVIFYSSTTYVSVCVCAFVSVFFFVAETIGRLVTGFPRAKETRFSASRYCEWNAGTQCWQFISIIVLFYLTIDWTRNVFHCRSFCVGLWRFSYLLLNNLLRNKNRVCIMYLSRK